MVFVLVILYMVLLAVGLTLLRIHSGGGSREARGGTQRGRR